MTAVILFLTEELQNEEDALYMDMNFADRTDSMRYEPK